MNCITISQLWKKGNKTKTKGTKFYTFKEFVTLHNEGKLDAKYYNGQSVCPKTMVSKTTVSIQYLPLGLIVIGAALLGYAIAKK
jgi:hypothetical protein